MILEAIYNGEFYPSEKVVPTSPAYIEALKTCEKLMEQLSRRLSKEDYALVEELQTQSLYRPGRGERVPFQVRLLSGAVGAAGSGGAGQEDQ